ncbi:MAG TPA: urate oxidase [Propionibacteriaceae bacterium]|nr:urate oxidase [Propionibacteriaceae bacterium]
MSIVLGPNQYGKAENRVVRIYRDNPRHEIRDINVSSALRGDFSAAHLVGDQMRVLPTDTQKQTIYAFAKKVGVGEIEEFALALGRHFVHDTEPVEGCRIEIDEYEWERVSVDGVEHNHTWVRKGQETRTTILTIDGKGSSGTETLVSGFKDLMVLKSTGSEFHDFLVDEYTTLEPTTDRVMATSLVARWRYIGTDIDWGKTYGSIRQIMLERFAEVQSLALQQTLYEMGKAVLEVHEQVAEIKFSAPNKHHFVYDLSPFGLENAGEVFHADDRPYGLIQATVLRDDAPPAGRAWDTIPGFA